MTVLWQGKPGPKIWRLGEFTPGDKGIDLSARQEIDHLWDDAGDHPGHITDPNHHAKIVVYGDDPVVLADQIIEHLMARDQYKAAFSRASAETFRANGWNPDLIIEDPEEAGPYRAIGETDATCGQCGQPCTGWAVIDIRNAIGGGTTWTHGDAEAAAAEEAASLNAAWTDGYGTRELEGDDE